MSAEDQLSEELRTRYDRQVRLWGSQTQQRLQSTVVHVNFRSWGGAGAELAKNLVLGGVGEMTMDGPSGAPKPCDLQANMFLLAGYGGELTQEAEESAKDHRSPLTPQQLTMNGLSGLNPFVKMKNAHVLHAAKRGESDPNVAKNGTVIILHQSGADEINTIYSMLWERRNTAPSLLVSIVHFGPHALALLLPITADGGRHQASAVESPRQVGRKSARQVSENESENATTKKAGIPPFDGKLRDPEYLERQPALFQRIVLLLHTYDTQKMTVAKLRKLRKSLGCYSAFAEDASDDELKEFLAMATTHPDNGLDGVSCIEAATIGGILCQQVISRIGKGIARGGAVEDGAAPVAEWLLFNSDVEMECLVGQL